MTSALKMLILLPLIVQSSLCMGQNHCLPIETSRKLVEDATKRYYFEALSDSLSSQVELLQGQNQAIRQDYERILSLERENKADLAQQIANQKGISSSHAEENKHLKKKVRSRTWQRNGAAVIALLFVGLSVMN